MEWQHRTSLFMALFSATCYVGAAVGHLHGEPGVWLGLVLLFGLIFAFLPQEERQ